jgi:anti-sigma28 factor (negative regulator of flagellin synthesis)
MDEPRTMTMSILRERLERQEYDVDPRKVADAIVERLLAASTAQAAARGGQCS